MVDLTNRPEVKEGHDMIDGLEPCKNAKILFKSYDPSIKDTRVSPIIGDIEEVFMLDGQYIIFKDASNRCRLLYLNGYEGCWKQLTDEEFPDLEECVSFITEQCEGEEVPNEVLNEVLEMLKKYFE